MAKGGLAIPVVLSTLGSKPVFGQEVPYNCTVSGKMSGNLASHGPPVDCTTLGDSPSTHLAQGGTDLDIPFNSLSSDGSTLLNAIEIVEPTDPTTCTTPSQTVTAPEVVPPTTQKPGGGETEESRGRRHKGPVKPRKTWAPESITRSAARFIRVADAGNWFWRGNGGRGRITNDPAVPPASNFQPHNGCTAQQGTTQAATAVTVVVDTRDRRFLGRRKPATLRQVLESQDGGIVPLARATIASYLNARRFAPHYPLTAKQVINMFNAVYAGGTYRVNDTTFWGPREVQTYFETLYR